MGVNLALYTLVVDRLEYTIDTIKTLEDDNNIEFAHVILSQGSDTKTNDWLKTYKFKHPTKVYYWDENKGISIGSNFIMDKLVEFTREKMFDIWVIGKIDNDIETITPNWLDRCYDIAKNYYILCSPLIMGLTMFPDGVPGYAHQVMGGEPVRLAGHIGGIVHMAKAPLHLSHTYPENMTYALDQDTTLSKRAKDSFYLVGYLEDVKIKHRDTTIGQKEKYPDYFHIKETIWEKESPHDKT